MINLKIESFHLSLFRILLFLFLAIKMIHYIPRFISLHKFYHFSFVDLPLLKKLNLSYLGPLEASLIFIFMITFFILAAISKRSLLFTTLSAITFFIFNGWRYGLAQMPYTNYSPHDYNAVVIVLFYLSLCPSAHNFSLQDLLKKKRPIKKISCHQTFVLKLFLSLIFAQGAFSKLSNVGIKWMDGEHLQAYMLWRSLVTDNHLGYLFAQPWVLNFISSIGVILFQLMSLLLVITRREKLFVTCSFLFFFSVRILMDIDFLTTHFPLFLIFINSSKTLVFIDNIRNKLKGLATNKGQNLGA